MPFHAALFALYSALGYKAKPLGLCYGFSIRWIEAMFLGEEDLRAFEQRMELISSALSTKALIRLIHVAKGKQAAHRTDADRALLELPAFWIV